MIVSFRHKGLEEFYRTGSKRGIQAAHATKLAKILSFLDLVNSSTALTLPQFKAHPLKGDRHTFWSMWVNGNWRVTFRFTERGDVELIDYEDYH